MVNFSMVAYSAKCSMDCNRIINLQANTSLWLRKCACVRSCARLLFHSGSTLFSSSSFLMLLGTSKEISVQFSSLFVVSNKHKQKLIAAAAAVSSSSSCFSHRPPSASPQSRSNNSVRIEKRTTFQEEKPMPDFQRNHFVLFLVLFLRNSDSVCLLTHPFYIFSCPSLIFYPSNDQNVVPWFIFSLIPCPLSAFPSDPSRSIALFFKNLNSCVLFHWIYLFQPTDRPFDTASRSWANSRYVLCLSLSFSLSFLTQGTRSYVL